MKKKIFLLINSLDGGGAEKVIINLYSELSKDYEIDLITLKNGIFYELPENIKIIKLSIFKKNIFLLILFPYYIIKFWFLIKFKKYINGVSFLEISNFLNIIVNPNAIISFRTNINFFQSISGKIYKILIKYLYPKAKLIIVNSEENKNDLIKYLKINNDKIITIYNPISKIPNNIKSSDSNLMEKIKNKKVFITVGRLIQQKNHYLMINSLKNIYDNFDKNWIYLIVGDGEQANELKQLVNDYLLSDNVIFLGAQKNVYQYLNISNYFLYASQVEGFPNVLIEAMQCGLPIITTHFKSGSQESIIGKYKEDFCITHYPYYGPNGVLLDINNYENDFLQVYKKLETIKQNKVGFENFQTNSVIEQWKKIF